MCCNYCYRFDGASLNLVNIVRMSKVKLIEVEDDILKRVAETYNKSVEKLNEETAQLQEWMKQQPHLPEIMGDKAIQNIYIANKCKMEKTKEKLDMYYTMRTQKAHYFNHINPKSSNMKLFMEACYATILPKMTDDMYRVFVIKVRNKDLVNDLDPYSLSRHLVSIQEIKNHEDVTFGDACIFDFDKVGFRFYLKFTPIVLYNYVKIYEKFFSSRLKAIYMLNAPFAVEKLLAIVKLVMKPKLFERIHLCKNTDAMLEQFSKKILPKDFGGEEKSLEELHEILAAKFDEYQERFDELDRLRVDESLRPVKKDK